MVVDQNYFIRKRPFFVNKHVTFAKLSQTPRSSFAEPMLGNNASYEDSFTTCQSTPENHGSLLDCLLNMQLASRNPFSGQIVADSVCFWQGLLTHPLQHGLRLSPAPSQNFRGPFAEISLFTDPGHQRGRIEGKANTRGLGVWLLQSLPFGNLAAACGASFLTLQKASLGSDSGRCKDVLQDHGVWLSRSLTFGSSAATYEATTQATEPEPNRNSPVPFSCQTPGGSGWQPVTE